MEADVDVNAVNYVSVVDQVIPSPSADATNAISTKTTSVLEEDILGKLEVGIKGRTVNYVMDSAIPSPRNDALASRV